MVLWLGISPSIHACPILIVGFCLLEHHLESQCAFYSVLWDMSESRAFYCCTMIWARTHWLWRYVPKLLCCNGILLCACQFRTMHIPVISFKLVEMKNTLIQDKDFLCSFWEKHFFPGRVNSLSLASFLDLHFVEGVHAVLCSHVFSFSLILGLSSLHTYFCPFFQPCNNQGIEETMGFLEVAGKFWYFLQFECDISNVVPRNSVGEGRTSMNVGHNGHKVMLSW